MVLVTVVVKTSASSVVLDAIKVEDEVEVEVVRRGTTDGACVGAPENVGSACGVAKTCPSGPRIRRAESWTSVIVISHPSSLHHLDRACEGCLLGPKLCPRLSISRLYVGLTLSGCLTSFFICNVHICHVGKLSAQAQRTVIGPIEGNCGTCCRRRRQISIDAGSDAVAEVGSI